MEILRPSTPMPLGRAFTGYGCFQMQRNSSDSLPPLQPLIEEKNSKRLCARRNQKVCQATRLVPTRHIVSSSEGESVEIIALSASSTGAANHFQGERSKKGTSNFSVLPELNSERLLAGSTDTNNTSDTNRRVSPARTQNINNKRNSTGTKYDSSSQSSNSASLPTVTYSTHKVNGISKSSSANSLQQHIKQQEKDFDSASSKADIFHRWIKSQQDFS